MKQRLYRSRSDQVLAGVCGGIAEYFSVDSSIVRIVTALMIIPGGLSIWVYIIAAIVIPKEPLAKADSPHAYEVVDEEGHVTHVYQDIPQKDDFHAQKNAAVAMGLILIGLGVLIFLRRFLPYFRIPHYVTQAFFPALLILGGLSLVFGVAGKRR